MSQTTKIEIKGEQIGTKIGTKIRDLSVGDVFRWKNQLLMRICTVYTYPQGQGSSFSAVNLSDGNLTIVPFEASLMLVERVDIKAYY